LLFPFPNRTTDGKYKFEDNDYQLKVNFKHENNAIHGLVYNQAGRVESQTASTLGLVFENQGFEGYPFKFSLAVKYSITDNGSLEIETEVTNIGESDMPFGIGWHPYFKLPNTVNELHLQLPASGRFLMSKQIPMGEVERYRMFTKPEVIDQTFLDDCFAVKEDETVVSVIDRKGGYMLTVDCGNHPYLQV
jgi:aldose 1-epimerase